MDSILVNVKSRRVQRGVSLIISLIMLVAMMLTGIAMFRKLGGGAILVGNLTFTSAAINSAEQGSESARAWLMAQNSGTLAAVQNGYFPASCYTSAADAVAPVDCTAAGAPQPFDPSSFSWNDSSALITADDGAGNEVRYVIHRMCSMAGSLSATSGGAAQQCIYSTTTTVVDHSGVPEITTSISPVFRITSRVRGPRSTTAYTQITMF